MLRQAKEKKRTKTADNADHFTGPAAKPSTGEYVFHSSSAAHAQLNITARALTDTVRLLCDAFIELIDLLLLARLQLRASSR